MGTNNQTLLQKAKKVTSYKKVIPQTKEMQEVALAWCRDEVTITQIAKAMGLNNTGTRIYSKIALSLKTYLNENFKIEIQPKK
jgi:hypothetical protein